MRSCTAALNPRPFNNPWGVRVYHAAILSGSRNHDSAFHTLVALVAHNTERQAGEGGLLLSLPIKSKALQFEAFV